MELLVGTIWSIYFRVGCHISIGNKPVPRIFGIKMADSQMTVYTGKGSLASGHRRDNSFAKLEVPHRQPHAMEAHEFHDPTNVY